jgi:hypothetical protein
MHPWIRLDVPALGDLRVSDDKECRGPVEDTTEGLIKGLRVECGEAFIEDDEVGILEKRAGDVEAAPFAVGELPTGLTDHLLQSGWHTVEEVSEAEFAAKGLSLLQIFGRCRPAAAHQQIERESSREDVVFVKLRGTRHTPLPAFSPQCLPVEPTEEEEARLRQAQASEERSKSRLAAAGRTCEEDTVASADLKTTRPEDRFILPVVAEDEIARLENRLCVLSFTMAGAEGEGKGRSTIDLRAGPGVEKQSDLLPCDRCPQER